MTDINIRKGEVLIRTKQAMAKSAAPLDAGEPLQYEMIELFFFAYRDFVADADAILAHYEFGRAHHRVLHFVDRNPGLKVAELLDILKITKQSLGRVLKELIDGGFVVQREGHEDRRQRLLSPTPKGKKLAQELAELQSRRFNAALAEIGTDMREETARFLLSMVDPDKRSLVSSLVYSKRKRRANGS